MIYSLPFFADDHVESSLYKHDFFCREAHMGASADKFDAKLAFVHYVN